jgi:tetratricopeptide (TPR) repeat protein
MIFYQGLARRALGRESEAGEIFRKLVDYGRLHLDDEVRIDYFAVSLPDFLVFEDDLTLRNRVHCHFLIALGSWGLNDLDSAREHFGRALRLNPAHPGAVIHHRILEEA